MTKVGPSGPQTLEDCVFQLAYALDQLLERVRLLERTIVEQDLERSGQRARREAKAAAKATAELASATQ
jgi:hypothetical protein